QVKNAVDKLPDGTKEFGAKLRDALGATGNYLGHGKTARVKSFELDGLEDDLAVKYLLTPTQKTLSAKGEYDMIQEAKRLTEIEREEKRLGAGENISVPHVHFHFKRGKFQCYGMELIKGTTLEQYVKNRVETGRRPTPMDEDIEKVLKERYGTQESRSA